MTTDNLRDRLDAAMETPVGVGATPKARMLPRRTGLGRGLGDLLPGDELDRVPRHFQPEAISPESIEPQTIESVAVVESERGVIVEIRDDSGTVHREPVEEEGSIDSAVINGVRAILNIPSDLRIEITDIDTEGGTVLLVTGSLQGERFVGAAFVEHRRPYALARAALAGLSTA